MITCAVSIYPHARASHSFLLFLQITLDTRYKADKGNDCLLSVDCVDMEILEVWPFRQSVSPIWFGHKFHGPGVRYEIALVILTGDVAWINGPFPCGQFNDLSIFRDLGLLSHLDKNERVEADNGYLSLDPEYIKCAMGLHHPDENEQMRKRVMGRQETINKRLKDWGCMSQKFIHCVNKHSDCFRAVMVILQLSIEEGEELFSCPYDDGHYKN